MRPRRSPELSASLPSCPPNLPIRHPSTTQQRPPEPNMLTPLLGSLGQKPGHHPCLSLSPPHISTITKASRFYPLCASRHPHFSLAPLPAPWSKLPASPPCFHLLPPSILCPADLILSLPRTKLSCTEQTLTLPCPIW